MLGLRTGNASDGYPQQGVIDDNEDALVVGMGLVGGCTRHPSSRRGPRPRPDYDRQRPQLFADSLDAVKRTLNLCSILNPGVLIR